MSAISKQEKSKPRRVIPERYLVQNQTCELHIAGKKFEILNYSAFGVAIVSRSKDDFSDSTDIQNAQIQINGALAHECEVKAVRIEPIGNSNFKIAFEVRGEPIPVQKMGSIFEGFEISKSIIETSKKMESLNKDFRITVHEVQDILAQLKNKIGEIEQMWGAIPPDIRRDREAGIATAISNQMQNLLKDHFDSLGNKIAKLPKEKHILHIDYFRQKLFDLIGGAPIVNRSYSKPLGYAGDYEMMNQIYRDKEEGKTLFEKCVHRYFINQTAAQAVKNRAIYLKGHILPLFQNDKESQILSLASGPSFELQSLFKKCKNPSQLVTFSLIDQDLRALQHAQYRLRELCISRDLNNVNLQYLHNNIRNILTHGIDSPNEYDLIYSAGLFDYLSDAVAVATMNQLYKKLKPGGKMIIGNFDVSNPSRFHMELALDWYLIHRSKIDMMRLGNQVSSKCSVESEDAAVNLFLIIEK